MEYLAGKSHVVRSRRQIRLNLQDAVQFFQQLANSSPNTFANLFLRQASMLLGRIAKGDRVTIRAWRRALGDVRLILQTSAANGNEEPRPRRPFSLAFSEKRMGVDDFNRRRAPATERVQAGAA